MEIFRFYLWNRDKSYEKEEEDRIYSDFVCEEELRVMGKGIVTFKDIEKGRF